MENSSDNAICSECANKLGGTSPEDYVCTMWMGKCPYCLQEKYCCALSDYNWPDRRFPKSKSEMARIKAQRKKK